MPHLDPPLETEVDNSNDEAPIGLREEDQIKVDDLSDDEIKIKLEELLEA